MLSPSYVTDIYNRAVAVYIQYLRTRVDYRAMRHNSKGVDMY